MCSRIFYETGTGTYITGRSMDWNDPSAATSLWTFPRGLERNGGGINPLKWKSKYGSVASVFYGGAAADALNEKGLVANVLYLAESDYGDPEKTGKPTISVGAWVQYFADNFATVAESVEGVKDDPFTVVSPILPNGRPASVHLSLSDASGDSAIMEYLEGKLTINHSKDYRVMTNSPVFEQQLAINTYWELIGGNRMLPGTINAADRYVRASYALKSSPKYKERNMAVASVFAQMRAVSVPLGMADPDHPNISATLWRTICDHDAKVFHFDSSVKPSVIWVDLNKVDLSEGADVKTLNCTGPEIYAGEVSAEFKATEPFKFL